jgi:DnaJ-class molecular chaperone
MTSSNNCCTECNGVGYYYEPEEWTEKITCKVCKGSKVSPDIDTAIEAVLKEIDTQVDKMQTEEARAAARSLFLGNSFMSSLKDHISGNATFQYYKDYQLWYKTENTNFLFPVPTSDIGTATFNNTEKGLLLMRYIRKHLDFIKESKE